MRKFRSAWAILILVVTIILGTTLAAMAITGQDVVDRVKDEYGDFQSQVVTMKIRTYDGASLVTDREVVLLTQKSGDVERSLVKFQSPKDVEGVGLLDQGEEVMYMYLPEFHKVRRIAGSAKQGSFMGTDFTYNDLSFINYDTSDYAAKLLDETDEICEVELREKNPKDASYEKVLMTVRKSDWFPIKVVFYNTDGKLQKELTAYDVTAYGKYRYPQKLVMVDILANHRTEILVGEPEFDRELADDIFTTRTLQRKRIRY
ncbi:MAG: outer membrane lipoprotein-sorting protein [Firmicutes bacterium]|nr:outer membrane lipoprotein-sorting protein [Bacillota bacterium]